MYLRRAVLVGSLLGPALLLGLVLARPAGTMTQALLGVYPDVFKAGASFAGVPAGCWSAGWTAASNWGGTCAGGYALMAAQQWGDLVRGMFPGYAGYRPRVQLFHGDADAIELRSAYRGQRAPH